jgi:CBS domain-containing protein
MVEPVVGSVMSRDPVTASGTARFKDVVCMLLASEAGAVPVVDGSCRPIGVVTEIDLLANLEFHGGSDAVPILGGAPARRRRRKASAVTAADLMTSPAPVVAPHTRISTAARRLAEPHMPPLCVVDQQVRLIGLLSRTHLLGLYRRPDAEIVADVRAAIEAARDRPTRSPAAIDIVVDAGVVTLCGTLAFRSRAEHAAFTASHVAGVIAVHNQLGYEVDDLMITGF